MESNIIIELTHVVAGNDFEVSTPLLWVYVTYQ